MWPLKVISYKNRIDIHTHIIIYIYICKMM